MKNLPHEANTGDKRLEQVNCKDVQTRMFVMYWCFTCNFISCDSQATIPKLKASIFTEVVVKVVAVYGLHSQAWLPNFCYYTVHVHVAASYVMNVLCRSINFAILLLVAYAIHGLQVVCLEPI